MAVLLLWFPNITCYYVNSLQGLGEGLQGGGVSGGVALT